MTRVARGLAIAAMFFQIQALAQERAQRICDAVVKPLELETHSKHPWRSAPGIRLTGDVAVCAYYQDEVPAGLSFSVHEDPQRQEFDHARQYYRDVQDAKDLRDAYYVHLAATAPFEPSWGLIRHDGSRTYRIEGIPEAGDAEAAKKLAREMLERAMKVF